MIGTMRPDRWPHPDQKLPRHRKSSCHADAYASDPKLPPLGRQRKALLRWVSWLCAYTGARVAEICQLRAEDVLQIDGIWCLRITPQAGPIKTSNSERAIPIHLAVIDEGFLDFARAVGSGPLFPRLAPDKFGSRGGNGTKIL